MKAMQLSQPGGLDNLNAAELAARDPQPGEIQVAVKASSLNFHDYAVVAGMIPVEQHRIPMSDGAGVVTAVGEGVTEFAVGDSVLGCFFPELAGRRCGLSKTAWGARRPRKRFCR